MRSAANERETCVLVMTRNSPADCRLARQYRYFEITTANCTTHSPASQARRGLIFESQKVWNRFLHLRRPRAFCGTGYVERKRLRFGGSGVDSHRLCVSLQFET